MKIFCAGLLAAFILMAQPPAATAGVVLITPEEAQLPTPKGVHAARAVTRGPRIDLAGPDASEVRSPLSLQLKFRGFGGATINLELASRDLPENAERRLDVEGEALSPSRRASRFRTPKPRRANIWFAWKSMIPRDDAR